MWIQLNLSHKKILRKKKHRLLCKMLLAIAVLFTILIMNMTDGCYIVYKRKVLLCWFFRHEICFGRVFVKSSRKGIWVLLCCTAAWNMAA